MFYIVSALLVIVALVLAAVGGLGLRGTMSINVLERTREIGVMRAVFDYAFSAGGTLLWLILFIVLGVVASLLPALNAARLTVWELLAYG